MSTIRPPDPSGPQGAAARAQTPALGSLRRDLARSLTLISTVWLAAVFLTMAFGVRHEIDDLLDGALQESAEVLYGTLVLHAMERPAEHGHTLPAPPHSESLVWQLVDAAQRVVLRSHLAPVEPFLPAFVEGFSDVRPGWRVYAMRLPGAGQVLYVGQPAADRLESRYEVIALVGTSGVLVGLACAYWMRRRVDMAMQPLQDLSDQVKNHDPMRPDATLPPASRQEFVDIRNAIVDLGQRLARRIDSEQAFAAHAAHALRTPLAGMDAQLAIALKEVPEQARGRLEQARQAVVRLKRVVDSLLTMFRSTATPVLQDVWLADLLTHMPVEGLDVRVEQAMPLRADPDLLAAALANLLDNAVRYGARQGWLVCQAQGEAYFLTLRDDGPGLDAAQLQVLRQRLAEPGADDALGLGLRLANLVARAHGGRVRLNDPTPGLSGFSVTLELATVPLAPVAQARPATGA